MDNNFNDNYDRIKDVDINSEMKKSYIDYAMSVIVSRALPDVRDGFKPVHRRIIYAMSQLNLYHNQKYRKSARIVGDVLGKYHPHSDTSIYHAMVRFAQSFSTRNLLVDGQGNYGSIDGDAPAAMRYTEARMTKLAAELLKDINKDTVDFKDNFDGEEKEPMVLPSRFPNLLVNGSIGIAVGMATNIPPHNLGEVVDACVAYLDDFDIDEDELISYIKGPDFPTGATMLGSRAYKKAYKTGKGSISIRSKYEIEEISGGKHRIVVSEIPYQVNKSKLLSSIADLVRNKTIDGITALRDESNRDGIRIVIEVRRDTSPNIIINKLFKQSQLQWNFSVNMIALVEGEPKLLTLKEIIKHYIDHQITVETRRINFDLVKANARKHILEAYIIAIDNIDEVIKIIRNSYDQAELDLMKKFDLSEIQAKAICDLRLRRLQGIEKEKIENEISELNILIENLEQLLADDEKLKEFLKNHLIEIKEKYSDPRRTSLDEDYSEMVEEDYVENKYVSITLTHKGYIKRVDIENYNTQNRGGKGVTGLSKRDDDYVVNMFTCYSHNNLIFFTNFGKCYRIKAYKIPITSRQAMGSAIVNFIEFEPGEKISYVLAVDDMEKEGNIVLLTKKGLIKKTPLSAYNSRYSKGLIAINLREGDELLSAVYTSGNDDLVIVTKKCMSIRFNEENIRSTSRDTMGVKALNTKENDEIICLAKAIENKFLLVLSEQGYGKKTPISEYKTQNRGGMGVLTYKKNEKTGELVAAALVEENDEIVVINSAGIIIRIKVKDVATYSRNTSGVRMMKLSSEEKIISMDAIDSSYIEEENESEEESELVENIDKEQDNPKELGENQEQ